MEDETRNREPVLDQKELAFQQSLKFAEDLAKVYQEEKARRKVLEGVVEQLKHEIAARRHAEQALLEIHQDLERRVEERTRELTEANERLQMEIGQRRCAEERINESLKEKEALLNEIHHRVKNNLQIVSSLLALQMSRCEDERIVGVLKDSQNRVRSMALIHEQLYRSDDLSRIDFSQYVEALANELVRSYSEAALSISINVNVEKVFLDVKTAIPCSLIINELVSNCLKHAFPGRAEGMIAIELRSVPGDRFALVVTDEGQGLPEDFDPRTTSSLGVRLITNLAQLQLHGSIEFESESGARVTVVFPDSGKVEAQTIAC